jgi:hypothetical protein
LNVDVHGARACGRRDDEPIVLDCVYFNHAGGERRLDVKSLLSGALVVAVGVLGHLYYDSHQTTVKLDVEGR